MKKGVLIIEGHVQGLSNTRALGEKGIPVYVIDKSNCIARYSRYCKKFFKCPDFKSDKLISFLIQLSQNENLDGWLLLPSNDHAVYNISRNKSELEKYYKIITPGIDIIDQIYDKANLLVLAEQFNVPYPKTQYFNSVNESISDTLQFPLLTKGRNGLSFYKKLGKKAFLAKKEQEFRIQITQIAEKYPLEKTFTQELIPFNGSNKTISFTAFADKGEIKAHWIGEKVREHPIQFGTATFARSISCPELFEPSQNLIKELNYTGVCEIEYLLDPRDNQHKLIEINARSWLWVELAKLCGINYALIAYNYVNDIENIYPQEYKIGKQWMHYITDIPYSMIGLVKGHYSIKNIFKTYLRFPKPAVFKWKDILPFFAEIILIPLHILKR